MAVTDQTIQLSLGNSSIVPKKPMPPKISVSRTMKRVLGKNRRCVLSNIPPVPIQPPIRIAQPSRDFEMLPACDCAAAFANATR